MAQADSVPTAIRRPITGATSKASTRRHSADRSYVIGGSTPYIRPTETEVSLLDLWREIVRRADHDNPKQNRCWHETITGGIPFGWYLAAVCYATAAILLGWYPWNFLLILLLFGSSKHLQLGAIDQSSESDGLRNGGSCR
jgi:hypothetical protein